MKVFEIKVADNNDWENRCQEVWSDSNEERIDFTVFDLNECPEDAIIGRDLFDADDYIAAIKLGFRIAKRGYDEIEVVEVPWEE